MFDYNPFKGRFVCQNNTKAYNMSWILDSGELIPLINVFHRIAYSLLKPGTYVVEIHIEANWVNVKNSLEQVDLKPNTISQIEKALIPIDQTSFKGRFYHTGKFRLRFLIKTDNFIELINYSSTSRYLIIFKKWIHKNGCSSDFMWCCLTLLLLNLLFAIPPLLELKLRL